MESDDQPEVLRRLQAIHDLIKAPEHWTTGAWARTQGGEPVPYDRREAFCFCLGGAELRINHDLGPPWQSVLRARIRAYLCVGADIPHLAYAPEWQDKMTHTAVVTAVARAIHLAERGEDPILDLGVDRAS